MKKLFSLVMALLMICLALTACGSDAPGSEAATEATDAPFTDENIASSLVGIWECEYEGSRLVYQFNEDGTGMASILPMTYTVENGVITITITAFGQTETGSAEYSASDDTLLLAKDGETIAMKKVALEELE